MFRVHVLTTGGTIASTAEESGAKPTERGDRLVSTVPAIDDIADVTVEEVFQIGSTSMDVGALVDLGERITDIETEVQGIVILHGTDTMEESAYYLDLTLDTDTPVVLTGAQRRPDEVSPDGPKNVVDAIRAASDERLIERDGVYIAFNDELHAARDVTKSHTTKVNTFRSPGKGPVAEFGRHDIHLHHEPGSRSVTLPLQEAESRVEMVKTGVGVDERQIRLALEAGLDGLILEGTGLGNTTPALGEAVETVLDTGIPTVVTSRCHSGEVEPVYGTTGGGLTMKERGAIFGDDLPAHKARIKLMLALETTDDHDELRAVFDHSPL